MTDEQLYLFDVAKCIKNHFWAIDSHAFELQPYKNRRPEKFTKK